jgi:hypothetical protein
VYFELTNQCSALYHALSDHITGLNEVSSQVDVTVWGSRMWSCETHSETEQDCRRRNELLGPSTFSETMVTFLRFDKARIFVRYASVAASLRASISSIFERAALFWS